jgi:O-antigen ligase
MKPALSGSYELERLLRGRGEPDRRASTWVLTVIIAATSAVAGALAGLDILLFLACAGILLVGALCLLGPRCRLVVATVGALVVFQSSFNVLKYAYLGLALLCFCLSLGAVCEKGGVIRREFRPMVLASAGLAIYLLFSLLVSRSNETPFQAWFRDALPYFMLTILPVVGIAAGRRMSPAWNRLLIISLGLVVSLGVTADWLERRDVSALPFGRIVLSSAVVVAFCFSYCLVMAGFSRSRLRLVWAGAAAAIVVMMIISGSRTNLVLLAAFIGVVGSAAAAAVSPRRALTLLVATVAALVVALPVVSKLFIADPGFIEERIEGAVTVLVDDPDGDGSFRARSQSYELVAEAFADHPVLGTGPGFLYAPGPTPTFNLDAPGIVPAKFGLVGLAFILAFLVSIIVAVRRIRRRYGPRPSYVAARGWLIVLLALIPFGPWLEDKGFPIALAIMFAALVSETNGPRCVTVDPSRRDAEPSHGVAGPMASQANGANGIVPPENNGRP